MLVSGWMPWLALLEFDWLCTARTRGEGGGIINVETGSISTPIPAIWWRSSCKLALKQAEIRVLSSYSTTASILCPEELQTRYHSAPPAYYAWKFQRTTTYLTLIMAVIATK